MPEAATPVGAPAASPARGTLYVREKVVRKIAERSVLDVPGVVRESAEGVTGVLARPLPTASASLDHSGAHVSLTVASAWPISVPWLAHSIRDRVAGRVHELTGLGVSSVDVQVARFVTDREQGRVQ